MKRKTQKRALILITLMLVIGSICLGYLAWKNKQIKKERDEYQFLYEDTINFLDSTTKGVGMLNQARNDYTLGLYNLEDCEEAKEHFKEANAKYRAAVEYFIRSERNTYTEAYKDFARLHQNLSVTEFKMNKELYNNCEKTEEYEQLKKTQEEQIIRIYGDAEQRPGDKELEKTIST